MKLTAIATASLAAGLIAAGVSSPARAEMQFGKAEDAIHYRQSALFLMGTHFSRIGGMVNDKIPFDAATAKSDAALVLAVSKLPWSGFVAGSDKGGNTKAKPEVWKDPQQFSSAQKRLEQEMPKLVAAADTGDKGQLKAAFGDVGAACKNCHDNFRAK